MELRTMADVGAVVRTARKRLRLTQTQLAARMGVTQAWVSRLENGNPRLEAQLVLDALNVLDVPLNAGEAGAEKASSHAAENLAAAPPDPFADVVSRLKP